MRDLNSLCRSDDDGSSDIGDPFSNGNQYYYKTQNKFLAATLDIAKNWIRIATKIRVF